MTRDEGSDRATIRQHSDNGRAEQEKGMHEMEGRALFKHSPTESACNQEQLTFGDLGIRGKGGEGRGKN